MSTLIFRGNERVHSITANDRGLMYGDGLFETLRAHNGLLPWWPAHWQRLTDGAARLGIAMPSESVILAAALALLGVQSGVLKIILTRGQSGRGYLPEQGLATCVLSVHPLPPRLPADLRLHWCTTPLAVQPALAGMKHLNRLENVLARAECQAAGLPEGLMLDTNGYVRCATSANVFIQRRGRWQTPALAHAGVAGVTRAYLLMQHPDIEITDINQESVRSAEAVFICNAVRGIMPVRAVGSVEYAPSVQLIDWQKQFTAANTHFNDEHTGHG